MPLDARGKIPQRHEVLVHPYTDWERVYHAEQHRLPPTTGTKPDLNAYDDAPGAH